MTTPLITRLEEAAEGSRELDALIWAHFRPEKIKVTLWNAPYADDSGRTQVGFELPPKRTPTVTNMRGPYPHAEPVTTSFDAAYALAERVLPEMNCIGFDKSPRGVEAYVSRNNVESGHWFVAGEHPSSPTLALCIATIKANHKERATACAFSVETAPRGAVSATKLVSSPKE